MQTFNNSEKNPNMSIQLVKRIFDVPKYQLQNYEKDDCLAYKVKGKWITFSTKEFVDLSNSISKGLLKLGVKPGDKIALISSNNRPEWNILDIGALQVGAITVPVYPTISESDYEYIFNQAEVKFCFVSDQELFDKIKAVKANIPHLKEIYSFDKLDGVKHWKELLTIGNEISMDEIRQIKKSIDPKDLATIIYTSGTTGNPKGVMLSHENLISNARASADRLPVDHKGKALSFLPLCHVYERMLIYLYMIKGVSIYYAESLETIGDNLREVKPMVFTAVPRLLEKVFDKIMAKGAELTGIKRTLFYWAVNLAETYEPYGKNGAWYELKLWIARKLIFKKWKEALGGNAKAVASGSAALQPRLARIFLAAGIPVMEGYGLTETSPTVAVNCQKNKGLKIGTVGRVLEGVQVKIAADGEILVKGPNVMMGYYKNPEKTKEVMNGDAWFHTGDIGELVDGEYLKITDRKKEIFKTSGGKYVAPQVLENCFKASLFIEQIMVVGENRKHPSALIVPDFEALKEYCKKEKIAHDNPRTLIEHPKVIELFEAEVDRYNKDFGHWEQVKKFELLPEVWTIESRELTPTMKLKRKTILEKYKEQIDRIYS